MLDTPCPVCETPIDINARICPQCGYQRNRRVTKYTPAPTPPRGATPPLTPGQPFLPAPRTPQPARAFPALLPILFVIGLAITALVLFMLINLIAGILRALPHP